MGKLYVYPVGHGAIVLTINGKVIQVDPYSEVADYSALSEADLLLITHDHYDHLDEAAYSKILKSNTTLISNESAAKQLSGVKILKNGEQTTWEGINIKAVPAYNIKHRNPDGNLFHPKGVGNGYVLTFGNFKLYIAGDTENIPELADLEGVDVAFLPKNLPFTMTDEMFVKAAESFKPKVLYPYHFSELDNVDRLREELKKDGVELKVFKK
ncbi:MAG: MBL fold metallo-hydrolase [Prevotellaceae bacterium]|jgi:L-ascorbate metabolism protein UlaG (beta-lactamase superfamily)|nr:MBL fold metallo-hydrolase [Prevotellaceae bacterium]